MRKRRLDAVDLKILNVLNRAPAKVGYLAEGLKLNPWTLRQRLQKLEKYGLVRHEPYKPIALTPEGKEELHRRLPRPISPLRTDLAQVVDALPTDLHRALFRLAIDVVIAKTHLRTRFREGWPAILVCGPTKSLKTTTGRLVARVLGLDPSEVEHTCYPTRVAPGDPGIRRYQAEGGVWKVATSPDFQRPFVLLDELDKAVGDASLRNSLFSFLDDRTMIVVEGQQIDINCTAFVTANWDREKLLENKFFGPFLRRAFVADTGQVARGWAPGYAEKVGEQLAGLRVPKLALEKIRPPVELPEEAVELVRRVLATEVLPEGRDLYDVLPVLHAIRGRTALVGDALEAAFEVLSDRLVLLDSLGVAVPGWRERLLTEWGKYRAEKEPELRRKLEEAKRRQKELEKAVHEHKKRVEERKTQRIEERLQFVESREDLRSRLARLRQDLARHRVAPGLRAALGELAGQVKSARTPERLAELNPLAAKYLEQGKRILEELRAEKEAQAKRKEQLRREKDTLRQWVKALEHRLKRDSRVSPQRLAAELERLKILFPCKAKWEETLHPKAEEVIGSLIGMGVAKLMKQTTPPLPRPQTVKRQVRIWRDFQGRYWKLPGVEVPIRNIQTVPSSWSDPRVRELLRLRRDALKRKLQTLKVRT